MHDLTSWEVAKSDVLVIGGGFGGLWSAIRAADCGASVTLVDKSFAGKSGYSYFASGAMMVLLPGDDLDKCIYDVVIGNDWLIDQEKVAAVFEGSSGRLKDLESYGINFRQSKGEYVWTRARGTTHVKNLWPENGSAGDELIVLRNVALRKGVRFVNHVFVYDLLKDDEGNVAGAVGIGVKNSLNYSFQAKAVIIATNTGSYRGHHLASDLQGMGPFMAYHAGAKIKNPEFHHINMRPVRHEIEGSGILPAVGARWLNGKGQFFMDKYDPVLKDRAPLLKIITAAAKEISEGNGPISIDVQGMTEEDREKFRLLMVSHGWQPLLLHKCKTEHGYDILRDNIEWKPAYTSNKLGVYCDLACRSSLNGLFAAGMARTLGINIFTGWSIAACTWSGYTAGESASQHAKNNQKRSIDYSYLLKKKEKFFAGTQQGTGDHPDAVVHLLQKVMFPVNVSISMNENSLKEALDAVLGLRGKSMRATDVRTLIKARETETMLLAAEMALRAALLRKETRPSVFYREDYGCTDNVNWLKWIITEKGKDAEISFSTEPIPFEKYRFKIS